MNNSLHVINNEFDFKNIIKYKWTKINYKKYKYEQKCDAVINLAKIIQENNGSQLLNRTFSENNKWYKLFRYNLSYSWNKIIKKFIINSDIKLSSSMSEIFQNNDVRKFIHNISDNKFIICITYHNGLDTQLGITERAKLGEIANPYLTAQRGVWEETGIFIEENVFNYLDTFNSVSCFSVDIDNIKNYNSLPANNSFGLFESKRNNKVFVLLFGSYNNIKKILVNNYPNIRFHNINKFYQYYPNISPVTRKKKINSIVYEYNTSEITIINKKIFEYLSLSFYNN